MAKEKRKVTAVAIQPELIESSIYLIRGQKVMLSMHLADLYEVDSSRLSNVTRTDSHPTSCSSCPGTSSRF